MTAEEQRQAELESEQDENSQQDDSSQDDKSVPVEDYKNLQSAYTQNTQELGRLQEKIEAMERSQSQAESDAKSNTVQDALAKLDDDEVRERVDADPSEAIPIIKEAISGAVSNLEEQFVAAMQDRDKYYHQQFKERDPAFQSAKEDIKKLREEEPAFRNLPDEALLAVVNRTKESTGKGGKSEFRGNPGGGSKSPQSEKAGGEDDPRKSDLYQRMYGDLQQ